MKPKLSLIALLFLVSCQSNRSEKRIIDYIKLDNNTENAYREYEYKTDTTVASVFIKQKVKQINDTLWEFEFNWMRSDSIPINKSIERYSINNSFQLIAQSYYYSRNSKNEPVELKSEIVNQKSFTKNSPQASFDLKFLFPEDKNKTIKMHSDIEYKFQSIDSLGAQGTDCMVLFTKARTTLDYSDARKDTTLFTEGISVSAKGEGLIMFWQTTNGKKVFYRLKK
jgi:hypothetical protein